MHKGKLKMTWIQMEKTAQDNMVCGPMFFKELKATRRSIIKPLHASTTSEV